MPGWFMHPALSLSVSLICYILILLIINQLKDKIIWLGKGSNPRPSNMVCLHPKILHSAVDSSCQYVDQYVTEFKMILKCQITDWHLSSAANKWIWVVNKKVSTNYDVNSKLD